MKIIPFYFNYRSGQAMITLLFFVIMGLIITSAAIVVIAINSSSTDRLQQAVVGRNTAESGIENALIRLLRDSSYSGETLPVGDETAVITVTGDSIKTITSQAKTANSFHVVEVQTQTA